MGKQGFKREKRKTRKKQGKNNKKIKKNNMFTNFVLIPAINYFDVKPKF